MASVWGDRLVAWGVRSECRTSHYRAKGQVSRNDAPRGRGEGGKRRSKDEEEGETKEKEQGQKRRISDFSREEGKAGQLKNKIKEVRPFGRKQWWSLVTSV
jgi:hypothetical protein